MYLDEFCGTRVPGRPFPWPRGPLSVLPVVRPLLLSR